MLEKAMKYIAELKAESIEPKVVEIQGKTYCNKDLIRYDKETMAQRQDIKLSCMSMLHFVIKWE